MSTAMRGTKMSTPKQQKPMAQCVKTQERSCIVASSQTALASGRHNAAAVPHRLSLLADGQKHLSVCQTECVQLILVVTEALLLVSCLLCCTTLTASC